MNITIRDLNEEIFRRFKARAAEDGVKLGVAMSRAMQLLIEKEKEDHKPAKKLSAIKPFSWGRGSEDTSKEIDALLYGE